MSEPVIIGLIGLATLVVNVIASSLIVILGFVLNSWKSRSDIRSARQAEILAADASAFTRLKETQAIMAESQTMMQAQANRRDLDIVDLKLALAQATSEIALLRSKLDVAEKATTPLHDEIRGLKKQVTEMAETIAGLQKTIATQQVTIDELRARKGEGV